MAAGDLTCTIVGTYATLALAVAAIDAETLPATTDKIEIIVQNEVGTNRFAVVKTVRAAS